MNPCLPSIFNHFKKIISSVICITFLMTSVVPPSMAQSVLLPTMPLNLPAPGAMINVTPNFSPILMRGVMIHPEDSLKFDFIIDRGQSQLQGEAYNQEANKLIKYFLASLTIPEKEMWVNLSPYEKDRIIPESFGQTEMGRDLLAQDYLLKQLTASLLMPEGDSGRKFWENVRTRAKEKFGTDDVPYDTFNKIWIIPEDAQVYENEKGAFVVGTHLKVLLEEDYLALEQNQNSTEHGLGNVKKEDLKPLTKLQTEVIREVLIPEIEKEVNEGETFANLRQIYYSMVLASWYKQALKESLLGKVYVDQSKTKGVDTQDPKAIENIYNQYVDAFKKGVAGTIKEDYDPATQEVVSRKYVTGGARLSGRHKIVERIPAQLGDNLDLMTARAGEIGVPAKARKDGAMLTSQASEMGQSIPTEVTIQQRILDLELKILEAKKQSKERVALFVSNTEEVRAEARQAIQGLTRDIAAKKEEIKSFAFNGEESKLANPTLLKHELLLQIKLLRIKRGIEYSVASDSMGSTNGRVIQARRNIKVFHRVIEDIRRQIKELPADNSMLSDATIRLERAQEHAIDSDLVSTNNRVTITVEGGSDAVEIIHSVGSEFMVINRGMAANASQALSELPLRQDLFKKKYGFGPLESVAAVEIRKQDGQIVIKNLSLFPVSVNYKKDVAMLTSEQLDAVKKDAASIEQLDGWVSILEQEKKRLEQSIALLFQNRNVNGGKGSVTKLQGQLATVEEQIALVEASFSRLIESESKSKPTTYSQDSAVTADQSGQEFTRGGIDLNSASMNMQIQRDGKGVPLPINLQNLENINVQGFQPIIINVVPITNLPLLLGLKKESSDQPIESSKETLDVADRLAKNPS